MTDDFTPTPDEAIAQAARDLVLAHEPQADASDLPEDVRDGDIEGDQE